MGFGHRVYKSHDPRARIIKEDSVRILADVDIHAAKFEVAKELERIALQDPDFIDRQLYPNVDFYSGITLSAMGFPTQMFTTLFALARTSGWIAQWKEMVDGGPLTIGRPRQHYTGPGQAGLFANDGAWCLKRTAINWVVRPMIRALSPRKSL